MFFKHLTWIFANKRVKIKDVLFYFQSMIFELVWNCHFFELIWIAKMIPKVGAMQRHLAAVTARYCNSSSHFKLQVVLSFIFQKMFFSKSTFILPINYI